LYSRMALNVQGLLGWTLATLTVTLLFGSRPMKKALLVLRGQRSEVATTWPSYLRSTFT
jgi:hypothetical protein